MSAESIRCDNDLRHQQTLLEDPLVKRVNLREVRSIV